MNKYLISLANWVRENGVMNGFAGAVVAALIGLILLLPRDETPPLPIDREETTEPETVDDQEPVADNDPVIEPEPNVQPSESLADTSQVDQSEIVPEAEAVSFVTYEVTMGTSRTVNKSGTDSDVQLQLFRGNVSVANLTFFGGRGEDDILEQRLPLENSERFNDQRPLVADKVRITLVTPRGNGGHWYGTRFQISSIEEGVDLCAVGEIGWLVNGASTVERRLEDCR